MDPGRGDRVTEIFLAKVARYPEWGELLGSIPDARISADGPTAQDTAPHA